MNGSERTLVGLVGFVRALRHSGMSCGSARLQAFLAAVDHLGFADRDRVYWAGRVTLCSDPDDLPRFDVAFAHWFGGAELPAARSAPRASRPARIAALAAPEDGVGEADEARTLAVASEAEVLRRRDIAELDAREREHLRRMLAELRLDPPSRAGLRRHPSKHGRLDPRATLREMSRTAGEPLRLPKSTRTRRPRRVVLLIDVSGSMSPYADALLRFAHVAVRRAPLSTEVFTLGTRMTRISRQLRQRDPERALAAASTAVPDFSGGTRLGETLRAFLDRWGQRGVARGAVVALFSDGWERGDASALGEQLRRLRRLARGVVWANPHAGREGYAPVQSGILAGLPHVDGLVAGHSLGALERVWSRLLDLSDGRCAGRSAGGCSSERNVEVRGA